MVMLYNNVTLATQSRGNTTAYSNSTNTVSG